MRHERDIQPTFDRHATVLTEEKLTRQVLRSGPIVILPRTLDGDDACRNFHVDNARYRLGTTYRGPGTQRVPSHALTTLQQGFPITNDQIKRLDRGCIAVMRNSRSAAAEKPGSSLRSTKPLAIPDLHPERRNS